MNSLLALSLSLTRSSSKVGAKRVEMCRSPGETAPSLAIEHVHTKDKIYFPECRVREPRNKCSAGCVWSATETAERSRQQKHSQIIKVIKKKETLSGDLKETLN